MSEIGLAQAKTQLGALVAQAEAGETVWITRHGKPVARLVTAETPRKKIDLEALRALTDAMRPQTESAGKFMRQMRDDARY